jgi:hypothetical protein
MLLEISSKHQRKYSLQGKEIISSGAKAYLNRDKVPSKPPCAYAQKTLRLSPKDLAPMPKIETLDFQSITSRVFGSSISSTIVARFCPDPAPSFG